MDPLVTSLIVAATNALIALGTWLVAQNTKRGREARISKRRLDDWISITYKTRQAAMSKGVDEADLPDLAPLEKELEDD